MNINVRSVVLIGIALLVALVTAFLARSLVKNPEVASTGIEKNVVVPSNIQIAVSAKYIPTGSFIKAEDIMWQSWPDDRINEKYIQKSSETSLESFVGSVVKQEITAGEPITMARTAKPGERGFLAAVLAPGNRAITIGINVTSSVAGFLFPGDRVDMLLTHRINLTNSAGAGNRASAQVSETVMSNLRVLAINQSMANPTHTAVVGKTVTFEVTPKQAEKITLIKTMGNLSLILRSLAREENSDAVQTASDHRSITWDNEVTDTIISSNSTGKSAQGNLRKVQIFRGSSTESKSFRDAINDIAKEAAKSADQGQ